MAVDKLKAFYNDKEMTAQVQASIINFAKDVAGQEAMNGGDTAGYGKFQGIVQAYFQALSNTYDAKPKKKEPETSE